MSVPDKAMKLKDGKIIADQLSSMIAVQFVQGTANAAGSYVVYNGEVFYLPDGHTAGTTWANTTKEGPTNIGEINIQLKNALQQRIAYPETAGTAGQVLGLDSNLDPVWEDVSINPEDIAEAVDEWLDDHPEATTTVEDDSITRAKLDADLKSKTDAVNDKAPAIVIEKESAYYHEESPFEVTFEPEERASEINAKYATSQNLISGFYQTGTASGVTRSRVGRFTNVVGTSTGGLTLMDTSSASLSDFAGKTYHFYFYTKKNTAYEGISYWQFRVNDSSDLVKSYSSYRNNLYHGEVTFPETVTRLQLRFNSVKNSIFVNGDCYWWGMYETELVDVGEIVDSESHTMNVSDLEHFDSALHKSTIKYKADTKTYIDDHTPDIIGYWNDNVYAMPEKFGAIGDGVADDTTALQSAVNYALLNGKPLRGFKKYKTTSPIEIYGSYADILINEITYTGNDAAVKVSSTYSKYIFNKIDSGGVGFYVKNNGNTAFSYNEVNIKYISAQSDAILFTTVGASNTVFMLYNRFVVKYAKSINGNVYNRTMYAVPHENTYYDTACNCPNGWAINGVNGRMYNFTLEGNVLNGINLNNAQNCEFTGFRYRELTDKLVARENGDNPDAQGGTLIKIAGSGNDIKFTGNDPIPYNCIDVSEATPINEIVGEDIKARLSAYTLIDAPIRYGNWDTNNGHYILGSRMIIIANKKMCVPAYPVEWHVTYANYDLRDSADGKRVYPSKFIIDVDDCVIHLSPSYSSFGYTQFIVDQNQGHLCTIYKDGDDVTPIFDGDTLGAGVYKLEVYCDLYNSGVGSTGHHPMNTGLNNIWTVTKLE